MISAAIAHSLQKSVLCTLSARLLVLYLSCQTAKAILTYQQNGHTLWSFKTTSVTFTKFWGVCPTRQNGMHEFMNVDILRKTTYDRRILDNWIFRQQEVCYQAWRCRSSHIFHNIDGPCGRPSETKMRKKFCPDWYWWHTKIPAPHSAEGQSRRRRLILPSESTL